MLLPYSVAALPEGILAAARPPSWNDLVFTFHAEGSRMVVVETVALAVATTVIAAVAAVFVALVVETAAPEPQIGPEGRVPAWVEQEREAATASRSAAAG